jgi:tetratricopeptide (TPR) repeat protein
MPSIVEALTTGLDYQRQGHLSDAEAVYRAVLSTDPDNADALHLLGVIANETGKPEAAADLVRQAIRLRPEVPEFHNTLATALHALRQHEEALFAYEWALRLAPEFPQAHVNIGNLLQDLGRPTEAVPHYQRAAQRLENCPELLNNWGNALASLGHREEALKNFQRALALRPGYAEAWANLAAFLLAAGAFIEAEACGLEAVRLNPKLAGAYSNLAAVMFRQERFTEAEACCRSACALQRDPVRIGNLAAALVKLDRLEEAESCCREALALKPDPDVQRTLGNVYFAQRRLREAEVCYDSALNLDPGDAGTHWNRAMLLLLRGEFDAGWKEYEWRFRLPGYPQRQLPQPLWDGTPLAGRSILLYAEQGLGDTIQFLRYVPKVVEAGGRVTLECDPRLLPLFRNLSGVNSVIAAGSSSPNTDFQSPLMSLPRIFGTTPDTIPANVPYLHVPESSVEAWRKRMEGLRGFRVGIAWTGNPCNSDNARRSVPIQTLSPLGNIPGVDIVCLQQGVAGAGTALPMHCFSGCDEIVERAALMMNLDLVIAPDTMLAHLAGALGRNVWTLLRFASDFRWFLDREDSPWYPTMKLFRQPRPGDWETVIAAVRAALEQYAGR